MIRNRKHDEDIDNRPSRRPDLNAEGTKRPQPSSDYRANDVAEKKDRCGSSVAEGGRRGKPKRKPQRASSTSSSESESSEDDKPRQRRKDGKPKLKRDELLAEVLKFLCNKKGLSASLDEICDHLSVKPGKIKEMVFDFDVLKKGKGLTVQLDLDLTICKDFVHKPQGCSQENCSNLHICPKLISDDCNSVSDDCELGHSFTTRHNRRVLDKLGIPSVSPDLLVLLLSRLCNVFKEPKELPDFCGDYNSGGNCSAGDKACSKFHICKKFIMSDAEPVCDGSCKLNHMVLKSNAKRLLESSGFDTNSSEKELRHDLKTLMKKKLGEKDETHQGRSTKKKISVPVIQSLPSAQGASGPSTQPDAVQQAVDAVSPPFPLRQREVRGTTQVANPWSSRRFGTRAIERPGMEPRGYGRSTRGRGYSFFNHRGRFGTHDDGGSSAFGPASSSQQGATAAPVRTGGFDTAGRSLPYTPEEYMATSFIFSDDDW